MIEYNGEMLSEDEVLAKFFVPPPQQDPPALTKSNNDARTSTANNNNHRKKNKNSKKKKKKKKQRKAGALAIDPFEQSMFDSLARIIEELSKPEPNIPLQDLLVSVATIHSIATFWGDGSCPDRIPPCLHAAHLLIQRYDAIMFENEITPSMVLRVLRRGTIDAPTAFRCVSYLRHLLIRGPTALPLSHLEDVFDGRTILKLIVQTAMAFRKEEKAIGSECMLLLGMLKMNDELMDLNTIKDAILICLEALQHNNYPPVGKPVPKDQETEGTENDTRVWVYYGIHTGDPLGVAAVAFSWLVSMVNVEGGSSMTVGHYILVDSLVRKFDIQAILWNVIREHNRLVYLLSPAINTFKKSLDQRGWPRQPCDKRVFDHDNPNFAAVIVETLKKYKSCTKTSHRIFQSIAKIEDDSVKRNLVEAGVVDILTKQSLPTFSPNAHVVVDVYSALLELKDVDWVESTALEQLLDAMRLHKLNPQFHFSGCCILTNLLFPRENKNETDVGQAKTTRAWCETHGLQDILQGIINCGDESIRLPEVNSNGAFFMGGPAARNEDFQHASSAAKCLLESLSGA